MNKNLAIASVLVLGLFGLVIWLYGNARFDAGKSSCVAQVNTEVVQETKKQTVKKHEVISLDDNALVRRYCRWVYDLPYDQCVKSVVPLR